jgi:hypothetical protein
MCCRWLWVAERLAVRKNGDLGLERGWVCELVWVWDEAGQVSHGYVCLSVNFN